MNKRTKLAVALTAVGLTLTVWCLARTTPLSMLAFFTLALPLFALAIALHGSVLLELLAKGLAAHG